ncbi:hypothetical protein SM021_002321 [Cronobacter muytjensii]|nr:hypothetical protein [Cronobacter muytjensii]
MHRLTEIKTRLDLILAKIGGVNPASNAGSEITEDIRELKDYVDDECKKLQRLKKQGELTRLEAQFVGPAIDEVCLQALDKIRRGARCNERVENHLIDTQTTLSWWLAQIENSDSITE